MNNLTVEAKAQALELAQGVIDRWESDRLTRVPLLHTDELPQVAGVYFAVTDAGDILYIGKANDLSKRCKISQHHKLPAAIEKGATVLCVAAVGDGLAWAVEQKLISHFDPPMNAGVSRWWHEKEKEKLVQYKRSLATYIDISAYWPKGNDGNPKSVNSVWEDARKNGIDIGHNTLTNAIGGKMDRVHLVNLRKLVALCRLWSGENVSTDDILRDEEDD